MGVKSKTRAEKRKEDMKSISFAKLNNCPTSPRKMRLIADMIRGKKVEHALLMLKNSPQVSSGRIHTLLKSAIANWQAKNEGARLEDSDLYIKEISVDSGRVLKRIRTAPQGRAHRIKKRSNHVTLIVDSQNKPAAEVEETTTETNE
ncbi:MAG: 50S ribosomal protein L22 [Bacteroidetes bacterium]|nr:50S ribosomal protein L22 [Bacteroidota bacterium]